MKRTLFDLLNRRKRLEEALARAESRADALSKELSRSVAILEGQIAHLSHRLDERSGREEAIIRFFEHRIDQVYARLLPVLEREPALFAGPDEPVAAHEADQAGTPDRSDSSDGAPELRIGTHLEPGRFLPPFRDLGFRLAPEVTIPRDDAVEFIAWTSGVAIYGPYKRLLPGSYSLSWSFEGPKGVSLDFDVYAPALDRKLCEAAGHAGQGGHASVTLDFTVGPELAEAELELRVSQAGGAAARILSADLARA